MFYNFLQNLNCLITWQGGYQCPIPSQEYCYQIVSLNWRLFLLHLSVFVVSLCSFIYIVDVNPSV